MAYATALAAALLSVLVAGCTGDSGDEGEATDAKGTAPAAQPGKYRTLLEPCGSIGRSTLKELLPGAVDLPDEQQQKILRGTPTSTFDTDRRVGCGWRATAPDASHTLSLDFERVVSYDPAVSDSDRAQEVFAKKQSAASLPVTTPSPGAEGSREPGEPGAQSSQGAPAPGTDTATDTDTGGSPGATDGGGSPGTGTGGDADDLAPRILDDLGDAAFLNDELSSAGAGSTARSRTVSVAFRTSNVIVTVVYTEQAGRVTTVPDSKELQDKARGLAGSLAGKFGG
ncbi:DUF3558 domain-containing protein [Streptomyces sp. NPDC001985]|uniref:DUF3558 domain-containing protein n=1 Tax=Streptomyces sp. NPDC001985 TaxID=3154406 RepID=UPI003322B192